jgi:hypothetical protein
MVWNVTGKPIHNDTDRVTGYVDILVCVNVGDDPDVNKPDVQPTRRPVGPGFKNKVWNDKVTVIENEEGVVKVYTGTWVDTDDQKVETTLVRETHFFF